MYTLCAQPDLGTVIWLLKFTGPFKATSFIKKLLVRSFFLGP